MMTPGLMLHGSGRAARVAVAAAVCVLMVVGCDSSAPTPHEGPSNVAVPVLSPQATLHLYFDALRVEEVENEEAVEKAVEAAREFMTRLPTSDLNEDIDERLKLTMQAYASPERDVRIIAVNERKANEQQSFAAVVFEPVTGVRQRPDGPPELRYMEKVGSAWKIIPAYSAMQIEPYAPKYFEDEALGFSDEELATLDRLSQWVSDTLSDVSRRGGGLDTGAVVE